MENLKLYMSRRHIDSVFLQMAIDIKKFETKDLCFFTILKGGIYTAFNVFKHIPWPSEGVSFGYLGLSSYQKDITASKDIQITYDLDLNEEMIKDKHVWLIDDICDSGRTLTQAKALIGCYKPKSYNTAVLVDKIKNREYHHVPKPDVVGLTYEGKEFLIGCGMGYGEKYRYLRELHELIL